MIALRQETRLDGMVRKLSSSTSFMKNLLFRMQSIRLAAVLLLLGQWTCLTAWAGTTIAPDNSRLQYTGRIDFAKPAAPEVSWAGTSVTANFTGSSLAFILDDHGGKNFFNVFIDEDYAHPFIIGCVPGEKTYAVTNTLAPGRHKFLLTKRTEGGEGSTVIKGVVLAEKGKLLAPPARPKHRMEIFGDSITSGMGNESPDDGPDDLAKDKNQFMTYGAIAARELNAELHATSQSGIGVMVSWFDFIMPQFYDQLSAVGNNDTHWDFSQWTPELVLINLFQNDKWLVDREKRLQPMPTDEQRIQAYVDFVKSIRNKYPRAYIVCALGSMDATEPGSKWPGYITAAVAQMKQETPKEKMDTLFFDFTGYGQHPRVKQHQANAAKLVAFVRDKMGW